MLKSEEVAAAGPGTDKKSVLDEESPLKEDHEDNHEEFQFQNF
jgi:hypothetical protein